MNSLRGATVAFDLFGTLLLPPAQEEWDQLLERIGIRELPQQIRQLVTTGFPLALVVREMRVPISRARDLYLTNDYDDDAQFIDDLALRFQCAYRLKKKALDEVRAITDFALDRLKLMPEADEVLMSLVKQGVRMQLVSDTSRSWSTAFDHHELSKWFPAPVFSWRTGRLKRGGAAFSVFGSRDERLRWMMVGDSWASDILGALSAGLSAAFVDRSVAHPARELVRDVRPLLTIDPCNDSVCVKRSARDDIHLLLGVTAEELERDPMRFFRVEPSGAIVFRCFDRLSIVSSIKALL